jgi:hypothetical protein
MDHAAAAGQQLLQIIGHLEHLLQVVEDEQPAVIAQPLSQRLKRRAGPCQVDTYRPGDAGQDLLGPGREAR